MMWAPLFFFFQAEDGIRYGTVTGVQTCALPIFHVAMAALLAAGSPTVCVLHGAGGSGGALAAARSEERRVGKEGRARRAPDLLDNEGSNDPRLIERHELHQAGADDQCRPQAGDD